MFWLILFGGIVLVIVASTLWLLWAVRHAPEGYQDENGFHLGRPAYLDEKFPERS